MKHFAIIGHPIAHSLSPLMHNTAFEALGLDCRYEAIDVEKDDLGETVSVLKERAIDGFNVTLPHKQEIMPLLDDIEEDAQIIGAVNTVLRRNDKLVGLNTDLTGFTESLTPFNSRLQNASVLLLGAGGAARAVLYGLLRFHQASRILILNRSLEHAEELAAAFSGIRAETPLSGESLFDNNLQKTIDEADVIINTTSVGMKPYPDASPLEEVKFKKTHFIMDLVYTPVETKLMKAASDSEATTLSGLEMFLHQAIGQFELWTRQPAPVGVMRSVLERHFST